MPSQVVHIDLIGNVTFSQNPRSKNIKVSVKADKAVLVSYPLYVSSKEVMTFVLKNLNWIQKQQAKMELRKTRILPNSELKTKLHTITFKLSDTFRITQKKNEITFYAPNFESDEAHNFLDANISEVYRTEAKRLLPVRLKELANRHGFQYNKVTIRNNRRNWGSCSSKNNISLNLQMMKLPVELIDHILLHELVHTEIKNHSAKFWEKLNAISNGRARELAREVKKYSTHTI